VFSSGYPWLSLDGMRLAFHVNENRFFWAGEKYGQVN
jgi:hypothetical protein